MYKNITLIKSYFNKKLTIKKEETIVVVGFN